MASPLSSRCFQCEHFQDIKLTGTSERGVDDDTSIVYLCRAYPEAIPLDVFLWERPHLVTFDGQVGDFVFKPEPSRVAANPTVEQILGA